MRALHINSTIPSVSYLGRGKVGDRYYLEDFEILTTIMSALYWRKHNGSIKMYTDSVGAKYYERLGLTELWDDGIDTRVLEGNKLAINCQVFWTFGRALALEHERAPVVSMDTDLIVWGPLARAINSDLMMLHSEPLHLDVYLNKERLTTPEGYRWEEWDWTTPPQNAGLIYFGTDGLAKAFAAAAASFMHRNPIDKEDIESIPTHDVFVAQRLLPMCAKKLGIACRSFLKWELGSDEKEHLTDGRENDLITHVWAFKQVLKTNNSQRSRFCMRSIARLLQDFPTAEDLIGRIPELSGYLGLVRQGWHDLDGPMVQPKKPVCLAPFLSLAIWANGYHNICCEHKGEVADRSLAEVEDVSELVNSRGMCAVRKQMMRGVTPNGCQFCLKESRHQPMIFQYYDSFDWRSVKPFYDPVSGRVAQTRYLLVALSNVCDYACRMCFTPSSMRLAAERKALFGEPAPGHLENDARKLVRFIKRNPLHSITFHGGNPINDPRFLEVLSAVDGSTLVEIISNGSTLLCNGDPVLPHLKRFHQVRFNISLDGTRQATEYIRLHSKFDRIVAHFRELKSCSNVRINIHNTISNLNVFDLPCYYRMLLDGDLSGADSISSYLITSPDIYCVHNLPPEMRTSVSQRLEEFLRELTEDSQYPASDRRQRVSAYVKNVLRRIGTVDYRQDTFDLFIRTTKAIDSYHELPHLSEFRDYFL